MLVGEMRFLYTCDVKSSTYASLNEYKFQELCGNQVNPRRTIIFKDAFLEKLKHYHKRDALKKIGRTCGFSPSNSWNSHKNFQSCQHRTCQNLPEIGKQEK